MAVTYSVDVYTDNPQGLIFNVISKTSKSWATRFARDVANGPHGDGNYRIMLFGSNGTRFRLNLETRNWEEPQ